MGYKSKGKEIGKDMIERTGERKEGEVRRGRGKKEIKEGERDKRRR